MMPLFPKTMPGELDGIEDCSWSWLRLICRKSIWFILQFSSE